MKKTIMIGPLPPPLGGATILFKQLADDISEQGSVDLKIINTYHFKKGSQRKNSSVFLRFIRVTYELLLHIRRYDSIGCHVSKRGFNVFAPLAIIFGRLFNKKVVIRKFGGELADTYKKSNVINKWVISFVMTADFILLETQAQVKFFNKELPSSNILWYPNSRPLSNNVRLYSGFNKKIIFLGHVKKSKGIIDLVQAVNGLDIKLDIYGPLEDVSASELNQYNVEYKGILDSSSVSKVISEYSLLVLPTYYEGEGYPGVILESYSVGVPVVSTYWRSIPEIVEDRVSGMLVEIKKPLSLRDVLREVSTDKVLYKNLCCGALKKFTDFDAHKLTEKYISII